MDSEGSITKSCPHCGGEIRAAARICKHCKRTLDGATPPVHSDGILHAGYPTHPEAAVAPPQPAPVGAALRYPAAASGGAANMALQGATPDDGKNPWIAAALGFLFGPLGLLYVSFKAAGGAFAVLSFISFVTGGVATLPGWLACSVVGYLHATEYNKARRNTDPPATLLASLPPPEGGQLSAGLTPRTALPLSAPPTETPWVAASPTTNTAQPQVSATPSSANKFCSACGVPLAATARFCNKCGSPA
mgnify:CR=1 FL=1